ncbi:MAG: DNA polymerase I [Chlamydiales bacterium]
MKTLYILDVSGYLFRAYFALPPMVSPQGESTNGLYGFIRSILKLFKDFNPEHIIAVFDSPDNKKKRIEIYEKYKANRLRLYEDLPQQIERAKEFCDLIGIPQIQVPEVEADDTMGSIAVWAAAKGTNVYLCTSDKDFAQLVNDRIFILNTWKDNLIIDKKKVEELYGVPPEKIIDLLAIVGDSSDNIPGVKGFGPKTTISLLNEFGSLETLLANADKIKGEKKQKILKEESDIALISKKLATIQIDISFPKEESYFTKTSPDWNRLKEFYIDLGFQTLLKELYSVANQDSLKEESIYHLIEDKIEFQKLLNSLESSKEIAFDILISNQNPLLPEILGLSFSIKAGEGFYVPLNGKMDSTTILNELKKIFSNQNLVFFGHHVKDHLHALAKHGIEIKNVNFDTILAFYLLHAESRRHSLESLILQYLGKVKNPIEDLIGSGKKKINLSDISIEQASHYCCQNVDNIFQLKKVLKEEIHKEHFDKILYETELPIMHVLAKMERSGIYLDREELMDLSEELKREIHSLEQEIYTLAGETFNINSPKQLAMILFDKMKIQPLKKTLTSLSTRAEILELLAKDYPIAEKILFFRSLEKLRSTYVETLPLNIHPNTNRIHATFNQYITATGRLTCQNPNLQNIPVRSAYGQRIRQAFKPQKKGWSYLSADYSQIELRLLAHLSEDPQLLQAFKHGEDIHAYTASLIFSIPLSTVSPTQRQQAKVINFGIIYGQQAFGLSQELGIDIKKAADFIKAYFERYPLVYKYIELCVQETKKTGKAITMLGRQREIPEIRHHNAMIRHQGERLAINTSLQGSAADLIKLGMLEIDEQIRIRGMQGYLILQIHDELLFECPNEEIDALEPLVRKAMETALPLKVPLVVDVAIGKNWAEC